MKLETDFQIQNWEWESWELKLGTENEHRFHLFSICFIRGFEERGSVSRNANKPSDFRIYVSFCERGFETINKL